MGDRHPGTSDAIAWDVSIFDRMSSAAQAQAEAGKRWILCQREFAEKHVGRVHSTHPALWFSDVMSEIEGDIDRGDLDAIELGCRYIIQEERTPFGKLHKCRVLRRLKRHRDLLTKQQVLQLAETYRRLQSLKYPPRELKELGSLLRCFE